MYTSIKEIMNKHEDIGGRFFSHENMTAWDSRIHNDVYGGKYFITSEKTHAFRGVRKYTIREAQEDGSIDRVGDFGGYSTKSQAISAIRQLLPTETNPYLRMRPTHNPYETWLTAEKDVEYRVLKKYQSDDTKSNARWYVCTFVHSTGKRMGCHDVYAAEIMNTCNRKTD